MDAEVKTKWVKALRSGGYAQGRAALRIGGDGEDQDRFCCLGVLCDVLGTDWDSGEWNGIRVEDDMESYLAEPLADHLHLDRSTQEVLAKMNDGEEFGRDQKNFTEIADFIEKHISPQS